MKYKESTVRKISHVCYIIGIWVSLALAVLIAFNVAKLAAHSEMSNEKYGISHLYGDKESVPKAVWNAMEDSVESNNGNMPIDFCFATNNIIKNTEKSYGLLPTYDQATQSYELTMEARAWEVYCDNVTFKKSASMVEYLTSIIDGKDPVSAYQTLCDFNNNNGFSEMWSKRIKDDTSFEIFSHTALFLALGSLVYIFLHEEVISGDGHLIPMIIAFIPCVVTTGIYSLITKKIDAKTEQKKEEEKFNDNYSSLDSDESHDIHDDISWYHKIIKAFNVDCGDTVRSLLESMKQLKAYYDNAPDDSSHSFYNIYCKELYSTFTGIREQFQRGTISAKEEIKAIEETCSLYHDIFISLFEHIKERDKMNSDNYEISNEAMRKYAQSMGHLDSDKISSKNSSENS